MNIVFMGTPAFAVPALESLLAAGYNVAGVVTQPDRPKGRKRELTPPPVKQIAIERGLPVYQPDSLRADGALEPIAYWRPDLIVTAAYGQILPPELLTMPLHRCINVHASLLPKYRGGAPIQHAIINGEPKTGVTIMYMERGLDTGDIIAQFEVPILETDDNGSMHDKLSFAGAQLLIDILPDLLRGKRQAVPQQHAESTFARNISREDERIDWSQGSLAIHNRVRGLHPWPVAYTSIQGEVFKVWKTERIFGHSDIDVQPGTIVRLDKRGMLVRTGDGHLLLTVVQPAGKKAMHVHEYLSGKHLDAGTVFD